MPLLPGSTSGVIFGGAVGWVVVVDTRVCPLLGTTPVDTCDACEEFAAALLIVGCGNTVVCGHAHSRGQRSSTRKDLLAFTVRLLAFLKRLMRQRGAITWACVVQMGMSLPPFGSHLRGKVPCVATALVREVATTAGAGVVGAVCVACVACIVACLAPDCVVVSPVCVDGDGKQSWHSVGAFQTNDVCTFSVVEDTAGTHPWHRAGHTALNGMPGMISALAHACLPTR